MRRLLRGSGEGLRSKNSWLLTRTPCLLNRRGQRSRLEDKTSILQDVSQKAVGWCRLEQSRIIAAQSSTQQQSVEIAPREQPVVRRQVATPCTHGAESGLGFVARILGSPVGGGGGLGDGGGGDVHCRDVDTVTSPTVSLPALARMNWQHPLPYMLLVLAAASRKPTKDCVLLGPPSM